MAVSESVLDRVGREILLFVLYIFDSLRPVVMTMVMSVRRQMIGH